MTKFQAIPLPAHRPTELRIECAHEGGATGRYRLSAYLDNELVNQEKFAWNVWRGTRNPSELVNEFIDETEACQPG